MRISLPEPVAGCIAALESAGHSAHAVGGCVRDSLLGRTPNDWDVCTSALPGAVEKLFAGERLIPTGLRHGTVTLLKDGMGIEITTLRRDGDYLDHRRPSTVDFTANLEEDLARRDFTVNAMAYSDRDGLCDPFGGEQDLAGGILRCVGAPEQRFSEDALRILRFFRFVSQLSFVPDPVTLAAAGRCRALLAAVSHERVQAELNRLLTGSGAYEALCLAADEEVLGAVLPEFTPCIGFDQRSPYHDRTVDRHTFSAVGFAPPKLAVRLALLLHDIGKPACFTVDEGGRGHAKGHAAAGREISAPILQRLRYPTRTADYVLRLIALHSKRIRSERPALRRVLAAWGTEFTRDMVDLKEADDRAKAGVARLRRYPLIRAAIDEIVHDGDCLRIADLAVSGSDITAAGIPPGPRVGKALTGLFELVLTDPSCNNRDYLLSRINEFA